MEIGDRVFTPDGPGTISGYDLPGSVMKRYFVRLDSVPKRLSCNPFFLHNDPAYFRHELTTEKEMLGGTG